MQNYRMKLSCDQAADPKSGVAVTVSLAATLAPASLALAVLAPSWEQQAVSYPFGRWIEPQ